MISTGRPFSTKSAENSVNISRHPARFSQGATADTVFTIFCVRPEGAANMSRWELSLGHPAPGLREATNQ